MSLAGITQHCKIMYSQSVQAQAGSAGDDYGSFGLSWQTAAAGLGVCQSHLGDSETANGSRSNAQVTQPHHLSY